MKYSNLGFLWKNSIFPIIHILCIENKSFVFQRSQSIYLLRVSSSIYAYCLIFINANKYCIWNVSAQNLSTSRNVICSMLYTLIVQYIHAVSFDLELSIQRNLVLHVSRLSCANSDTYSCINIYDWLRRKYFGSSRDIKTACYSICASCANIKDCLDKDVSVKA